MLIMKGLIIIYTGNGKGKTTAALGAAMRTLAYEGKVAVIQFIKERMTGELKFLSSVKKAEVLQMGKGFYKSPNDRKDPEVHKRAAQKAWEKAKELISSEEYNLVILDEINCAIDSGLIKTEDVVSFLKKRNATNIILTGRGAPKELISIADLVTEMREIKHPFKKGVPARKGIDF
ncbi:cob(I)yrinic acid a,c-diamide adenosyltransferase [Candidatus Woesearchaeota archaeon]|nr:MAG: cob(I)yrinic acid a,c-diamide adenosyltransferase [Candidatus Woesearchaeota archaeon]